MSTIYFDLNDFEKSIYYSQLSCKIGRIESCHNVAFIKYQQGFKEDAISEFKDICSKEFNQSCKFLESISEEK